MKNNAFATGTLAAAVLAGGSYETSTKPVRAASSAMQRSVDYSDRNNLHNILSDFEFLGQDGKPVNLNGLKASIQNGVTTLTFGFTDCEQYCPMINNVLAAVGKANPDITSVVISVNPEKDGKDQQSRDAFMAKLRKEGIKHKVVILYPSEDGNLSQNIAPKIAIRSGAITNPDEPLNHSAKVQLFGPNGAKLKEKSGLRPANEFLKEWNPIIRSAAVDR